MKRKGLAVETLVVLGILHGLSFSQTPLQHLWLYLRCPSGRAFVCTFISPLFSLPSKAAVYLEQRSGSIANSFDELSVAAFFVSFSPSLPFYLFARCSVCPLSPSCPVLRPDAWPWVRPFKDAAVSLFLSAQTRSHTSRPFFYLPLVNGKYSVSGFRRIFLWYAAHLCSQQYDVLTATLILFWPRVRDRER